MSRAVTVLTDAESREQAKFWIDKAPNGTRMELKAARRTLPQNAKMWVLLNQISQQIGWDSQDGRGVRRLTPEAWKLLFLTHLRREGEHDLVQNIDGDGWIDLNMSTSDMTKEEMSNLIEIVYQFGANHNVRFRDDR